jgi:uroporphyrinogen-III synthase
MQFLMKDRQVHILSTRLLDHSLIEKAAEHSIIIEAVPFIKTEPIKTEDIRNQILAIARMKKVVIFSSANAVESVAGCLTTEPEWMMYCVGKQTAKLAQKNFPKSTVVAAADNALQLSHKILSDAVHNVTFICGNLRRDDLPDELKKNKVAVEEIIVYNTELTPRKCISPYEGIIFFSPTAVQSFFSMNSVAPETVLFAIGNTTSTAIEQYASNKVITTEQPGKEQLIDLVIRHFQHINQN